MNEREKRFCEEYMVDLCAARAARRAGYSPWTADHHAAGWITLEHPKKPELREEIDRMLAERARRVQLSADSVVGELMKIAFGGEEDAADEGAEPAPGRQKSAADGVRVQDRLRALEMLGKHLGIFTENMRVEQVQPVIVDETGGADEASGADEAGSEGGDGDA